MNIDEDLIIYGKIPICSKYGNAFLSNLHFLKLLMKLNMLNTNAMFVHLKY